jgi:hypothetical protein
MVPLITLNGFVFFFLVVSIQTQGQNISYSPYSAYGIGLINERGSALNRSLMNTGIGIRSENNLNLSNPASFTAIKGPSQITELGMFYESGTLTNDDLTEKVSNGKLSALNMWFRLNNRWSAAVGLAPYSTVNYSINTTPNTGDGSKTQVLNTGEGGLNQYYLSTGFRITDQFSIGGSFTLIAGSIRKKETVTSGDGSGIVVESKTVARRASWDVGAQYTHSFNKKRSLTIGTTFSPSIQLNTRKDFNVYQAFGQDTLFTEDGEINDYKLPQAFSGGLAFNTKRSLLAVDYRYSDWKTGYLDDQTRLRATSRLSAGYNYKGNPDGERYLDFVELRTGLYFEENYLVIRNNTFTDWGVSVGTGVPFNSGRAMLNLTYSYNVTGTRSANLISQRANVFSIDIVFRDLWQRRRISD